MEQSKEILFSNQAREKLLSGVEKLSKVVKVTMGPRGRNVLLQKENGGNHITKDGVSVAKEVFLSDNIENMGAQLVKEVSANTAQDAGDGTTTATVLAHAIFKEGYKIVTSGANPVEIKRGLDKTADAIIQELKKNSREIKEEKEIRQVATISANGDEEIGSLIASGISKVGLDGVITVEEAFGVDDELNVVEGMRFDRGYMSPHFVTNEAKMICELENPIIFITDHKIGALKDIVKILEQAQSTGRPLLMIVDDMLDDALNTLVLNKLNGVLNAYVVKAPGFGARKLDYLEDIAVLTGGVLINRERGVKLSDVDLTHLGEAERVTISRDFTTIVGGKGDKEDLSEYIEKLKSQIEICDEDYEKGKLRDRLAKLTGGIAVLKIGAQTEAEMNEKKDRVDDALAATTAAVQEGIVIGGGTALVRAGMAESIENLTLSGDQYFGKTILLKAIEYPFKQIQENANANSEWRLGMVKENTDINHGFDATNGELVDFFEAGIIDPLKVTRVALQNAVSVAGMLLTTEATIGFEDQE